MHYDIGLRITYRYDHPANAGRHLLRLMPADLRDEQRLVRGSLDVEPHDGVQVDFRDFFGNKVTGVALVKPHAELCVQVRARVQRLSPKLAVDASPDIAGLVDELGRERSLLARSPHHFLGRSARVAPTEAMTAFAQQHRGEGSVLQQVQRIGQALHEEMRFDPQATHVDTSAEDAFHERHGVCQDFSHIFIACLRGLGIPAGYVSGLLRTEPPAGQARLEGADAMHAWVSAWCGQHVGWIEYDPTNGQFAGEDYILIARGRDYADVSPVRGVLRTSGAQRSAQAVDVIPVPEPEPDPEAGSHTQGPLQSQTQNQTPQQDNEGSGPT